MKHLSLCVLLSLLAWQNTVVSASDPTQLSAIDRLEEWNPRRQNGDGPELKLRYRLLLDGEFSREGLKLTGIDPRGPKPWKAATSGHEKRLLEVGDTITKLANKTICSGLDYYFALNSIPATNKTITITIRNAANVETDWLIEPFEVHTPQPPVHLRSPASRAPCVNVLLIASTIDANPSFRQSIEIDVRNLRDMAQTIPGKKQIIELRDQKVTSDEIRAVIRQLTIGQNEALVCFYCGHGEYTNEAVDNEDHSKGHVLAFPTSRLRRQEIWNLLKNKNAQLTALITDCCNVGPPVADARYGEKSVQFIVDGDNWVLGNLFCDHKGYLDISAAKRDQASWGSADIGGWFTQSLVLSISPQDHTDFVRWTPLLQKVNDTTSEVFKRQLKSLEGDPLRRKLYQQMKDYGDQNPIVYVNDVSALP